MTPSVLCADYASSVLSENLAQPSDTDYSLSQIQCSTPLERSYLNFLSFEFHAIVVTSTITLYILVIYCPSAPRETSDKREASSLISWKLPLFSLEPPFQQDLLIQPPLLYTNLTAPWTPLQHTTEATLLGLTYQVIT